MGMWKMASSAWSKPDGRSDGIALLTESFNKATFAPDIIAEVKRQELEILKLETYRRANAAKNRLDKETDTLAIVGLNELAEFQNAPDVMQGYLVAQPQYRELYNKNMAAGFERGFSQRDIFRGNAYMHTDTNYREVTNGVVTKDEEHVWTWVTPDDKTVTLDNIGRAAILYSWDKMSEMEWSDDDDMLSQMGASL